MNILVTGATGFIGSHTCVELLNAGYDVIGLDNLSNSKREVADKIRAITGRDFKFYVTDLLDCEGTDAVFCENNIDAVIHFAGLKAVGESVEIPLKYYHNNITGTVNLCTVMSEHGVKRLVFSSSATVYGNPHTVPIKEDFPLSVTNPYGRTKLMIEEILRDVYVSDNEWSIVLLRYFNPIGAHKSGLIGEDPKGIPNNLVPYIAKVAIGRLECLSVYGDDYPTVDGTGVRDYIHVVDLSKGHLKAVEKACACTGVNVYNLGTGNGYSVLEVVRAFENACGRMINYKIVDRRAGDIAVCYADTQKAASELGWKAEYGIDDMCKDMWAFASKNF